MARQVKFGRQSAICSGDQIEKNEVGRAFSTYGGEDRCIQDFGGET